MSDWKMKQRNFIGRLVSRKRNENDWTQDVFADKLQLAGWHDATRSTVSKIEDGSLRIDLLQRIGQIALRQVLLIAELADLSAD